MNCHYCHSTMRLEREIKHKLYFSCSHKDCENSIVVVCYDEYNDNWFVAYYNLPFKYNDKKLYIYSSCFQEPRTYIFDKLDVIIKVNKFFEIKTHNLDIVKIANRLLNLKAFL